MVTCRVYQHILNFLGVIFEENNKGISMGCLHQRAMQTLHLEEQKPRVLLKSSQCEHVRSFCFRVTPKQTTLVKCLSSFCEITATVHIPLFLPEMMILNL